MALKILIIAATHGNEPIGPRFYSYLLSKRADLLENVELIIGNPRAFAKRVRYIESDLNRSYQIGKSTYEQRRANEIEEYVKFTKPDLVIDMHSTACIQPRIMIVRNLHSQMVKRFLRNCHVEKVLKVTTTNDSASITPHMIAYEVMNRDVNQSLFADIADDIDKFLADSINTSSKLTYQMTGKIYKSDVTKEQARTLVNFEMNPLGFIPIMTGNNSYKKQTDYLGFKAETQERVILKKSN